VSLTDSTTCASIFRKIGVYFSIFRGRIFVFFWTRPFVAFSGSAWFQKNASTYRENRRTVAESVRLTLQGHNLKSVFLDKAPRLVDAVSCARSIFCTKQYLQHKLCSCLDASKSSSTPACIRQFAEACGQRGPRAQALDRRRRVRQSRGSGCSVCVRVKKQWAVACARVGTSP
jgi:hypothetical protein